MQLTKNKAANTDHCFFFLCWMISRSILELSPSQLLHLVNHSPKKLGGSFKVTQQQSKLNLKRDLAILIHLTKIF